MSDIARQRVVKSAEAADAFSRGMGHYVRTSSAFAVTADVAYSYAEPIAVFDPERRGTVRLSDLKYSVTTSKHIGLIRRACEQLGVPYEVTAHDRVKALAAAAPGR